LKVEKALISVYDKSGIAEFARGLASLGVEIYSSGGTAKELKSAGVPHILVEDYTGFPEMLDGRVKTIHPKIHGGILARRDNPKHLAKLEEHGILKIDLVAVNLYPFKQTIARKESTLEEAVEQIDVGGPTLIRSAAKNFTHVGVIVDPKDYGKTLGELRKNKSGLSPETLRSLSVKAFAHTADYDIAIHNYLSSEKFPQKLLLSYDKVSDLRYGENWHQLAAFYRNPDVAEICVSSAKVVRDGRGLSFNNLLDLDSALELVKEFEKPAAVIVKHLNPSGVGVAENIFEAYGLAHKADPLSAFGCIVALNRPLDEKTAEAITSTFVEAVIAPKFSEKVLQVLAKKEKMRLFETGELKPTSKMSRDFRKIVGGMLVQTRDLKTISEKDLEYVSDRKPTKDEVESMLFAWNVCRHTKSNSIIFAKKNHTVGIGAGQMSRVDAVKIAAMKSGDLAKGAAMASDAFFPFRDGIDEAAKAGITAVIHPGGSIRDKEVLDAVNEHGMAMAYTKTRCFLH